MGENQFVDASYFLVLLYFCIMKVETMMSYKYFKILVCFSWMVMLFSACADHSRNNEDDFLNVKEIFLKASDSYRKGDYLEAEARYKKCIALCLKEENKENDSILALLPRSMGQLMNTYQGAGKPEECIHYFKRLRNDSRKDETLKLFQRDIQVLLAYSLSRTEKTQEAARAMDSVWAMPLYQPTPEKKFRDYAYASAVYFCIPEAQAKVLEYGTKALQEAKLAEKKSGVQWLTALLGSLYQRTGDIVSAIKMYEDGYYISEQAKDTLAMVDMTKSVADFLLYWNMADEADYYATTSVSLLKKLHHPNPQVAAMAYITKATVEKERGSNQKAFYYLGLAKEQCKDLPYNSGNSDVDVVMGTILVQRKNDVKQYNRGMRMLAKASRDATYGIRSTAFFEMAKCYIDRGDNIRGEMALDSMYQLLNTSPRPIVRDEAYGYALSYYLKTQNKDKVMQYANAINQLKIKDHNKEALKKVTRTLVKLETAKKSEQLRENAIAAKQSVLKYRLGVSLLMFLLVCVVVFFVHRWLAYRRKHSMIREQLDSTTKDLEQTVKDNKKIMKQLRTMEKVDEKKVKDGVSLSEILMEKGDAHFRELFGRAYPYFIPMVQKQVLEPLTSKETLLCMLIALKKDNREIADMFHITRKSVNMAKYRLRKKFDLVDKKTLEDILLEIMQTAKEKA